MHKLKGFRNYYGGRGRKLRIITVIVFVFFGETQSQRKPFLISRRRIIRFAMNTCFGR